MTHYFNVFKKIFQTFLKTFSKVFAIGVIEMCDAFQYINCKFIFKQVMKSYLSGLRHQFRRQDYVQTILIKKIL